MDVQRPPDGCGFIIREHGSRVELRSLGALFTLTKVARATPPTARSLPCSELRRGFSLRNAEATPTGPDRGGPVSFLATQRGRTRRQHVRLEELDVAPNLDGLDQKAAVVPVLLLP